MAGFAAVHNAYAADSDRLPWPVNGHFYQLFEPGAITWNNAKKACEAKSAHLATITSVAENAFIKTSFLDSRSNGWYHIGGTDATTPNNWKWITGEPLGYPGTLPWSPIDPSNGDKEDYLAIADGGWSGLWGDTFATINQFGYICEWSTQNFIDTTLVPDQNGNGVDEIAALFVNFKTGQHTVQIKDPLTDTLLTTLTFRTGFTPPSGMVMIPDISGNKIPEIGVLYTKFNFPNVLLKDIKTKAEVSDIDFMTPAFRPNSVGIGRDKNGNGAVEIVVLGINKTTGAAKAEIRDSKTKAVLGDTPF